MSAIKMLEAAEYNALSHRAGMPSFHFDVSFESSGALSYTGAGASSEIWESGRNWQVAQSIGNYSMTRRGYAGVTLDVKPVGVIPMRAQMVRSEFMWPTGIANAATLEIRKSAAQWEGEPVTCLLFAGGTTESPTVPSRRWEEMEYCIGNNSHLLRTHSVAPGTFAVFGYSRHLQFHGRSLADKVSIYVNGTAVADANFTVSDVTAADQALLAPAPPAPAPGQPFVTLSEGRILPMDVEGASGNIIEPVLLHVQLGPDRTVLESEVCAAADVRLAQKAQDFAKSFNLSGIAAGHVYLELRFQPAQNSGNLQ
jgi:hypothetical protein